MTQFLLPSPLTPLTTKSAAIRLATGLFGQQFWCWGQDIRCDDGNLLLQFGFQRTPPPVGSPAVSLYRLEPQPGTRIILRGFGMFYGDDRWGGLFLRRYGFSARLTALPDLPKPAWLVDDLPKLSTPRAEDADRCLSLLQSAVRWIADYELLVRLRYGTAFRNNCLERSNQLQVVSSDQMVEAWCLIADTLMGNPDWFIGANGTQNMPDQQFPPSTLDSGRVRTTAASILK